MAGSHRARAPVTRAAGRTQCVGAAGAAFLSFFMGGAAVVAAVVEDAEPAPEVGSVAAAANEVLSLVFAGVESSQAPSSSAILLCSVECKLDCETFHLSQACDKDCATLVFSTSSLASRFFMN
eukprot:6426701-Pyramimonas_sp.AAC.1